MKHMIVMDGLNGSDISPRALFYIVLNRGTFPLIGCYVSFPDHPMNVSDWNIL
jgi:hypothetical protein